MADAGRSGARRYGARGHGSAVALAWVRAAGGAAVRAGVGAGARSAGLIAWGVRVRRLERGGRGCGASELCAVGGGVWAGAPRRCGAGPAPDSCDVRGARARGCPGAARRGAGARAGAPMGRWATHDTRREPPPEAGRAGDRELREVESRGHTTRPRRPSPRHETAPTRASRAAAAPGTVHAKAGGSGIQTLQAKVLLKDVQAPTVQILGDTALAGGAWVRGDQPLNYTASDNIGIERAQPVIGGVAQRAHPRPCLVTAPGGDFTALQPCPNGPGQLDVRTGSLAEGTQQLAVQAEDAASNAASSEPLVARIDNTAPARVDVALEGGDQWRNQNAWTAVWENPDEGDRAPIIAADYKLCESQDTTSCSHDTQAAPGISRLPLTVPGPGEWKLSVWRTDAAGNQSEAHRSVPVTLRYDPEPPKLAFEPPDPADPTLVAAHATDDLSGIAGGMIDIAPAGTTAWQSLPTGHDDGRLVARIDDATLPPGAYLLRAHASDRAGNQTTQDRRGDGQPMVVTLPLRKPASFEAGFERTVRRPGRRPGTYRGAASSRPSGTTSTGQQSPVAWRRMRAVRSPAQRFNCSPRTKSSTRSRRMPTAGSEPP